MALAAVVGLRHQPDTRTDLAPVAELAPEQLERQARRAYFANALQARQVIASLARGYRHARLPRLLERRELLGGQRQPFALAQQPLEIGRTRLNSTHQIISYPPFSFKTNNLLTLPSHH